VLPVCSVALHALAAAGAAAPPHDLTPAGSRNGPVVRGSTMRTMPTRRRGCQDA
jgi:hypothetical protein